MTYTVTELIADAYYTSGIVGREFEQVSGSQLNDGLRALNALLDKKTLDKQAIPYFTQFNSTMVVGQEKYFVPGLISAETAVFFIDPVRYPVRIVDRKYYWATPRANNIQSLPYQCTMERTFDLASGQTGSDVYFYFLPSQAYPYQIWGIFALANVSFNDDLQANMSPFYRDFLHFELSDRLCNIFNYVLPPGPQRELDSFRLMLDKREQRLDLVQTNISALSNNYDGMNYAWYNLGTGWGVPG